MKRLFAVALVLVGCSHQRVLEKPIHPVEPAQFWKDQAARRAFLSEFSGKLKLGYVGKKQDVSGKGRIVGRAPSAYRVELRDAIGRLHYVLLLNGSQLVVHYPRNKQALKENAGGKLYFKRTLGKEIAFSDLAALFAGVLPQRWDKMKFDSWEWDKSKGAFRGELHQGDEQLIVWVDSGNEGLQSFVWNVGGEKVEGSYSAFDKCCDSGPTSFDLAYEVKVQLPAQETAVEVSWDGVSKPTQATPSSAFEFVAPAGDKVQEIR